MLNLAALFAEVSALKPADRKVLASKTPKKQQKQLPSLGGVQNKPAPNLLTDEVFIQSEWYISPEDLQRVRDSEKWRRVGLVLHVHGITCACCHRRWRESGQVYVELESRTDSTARRFVSLDTRSDPTDLLLDRRTEYVDSTRPYCDNCFEGHEAHIKAWEAQLSALPSTPPAVDIAQELLDLADEIDREGLTPDDNDPSTTLPYGVAYG